MGDVKDFPSVVVRCRGVTKELGSGETRSTALRALDLDVLAGEMLMLVGPSGCGKTTLVSIMAGILRADAGRVEVFGTCLDTMSERKAARFRASEVGFVPQQFSLLPALDAVENVAVPLLVQRVGAAKAHARAAALLEQLGLGPHARKYPSELSMGQQQRVAIARALVHEPRLVICDEPTAALDAASGYAAVDMLRRLARRPDRTVVLVTHDPRILPLADRIAMMSDGTIVGVEVNVNREAA